LSSADLVFITVKTGMQVFCKPFLLSMEEFFLKFSGRSWEFTPDQAENLKAPDCRIHGGVLQAIQQYYAVIKGFFKEICCQV